MLCAATSCYSPLILDPAMRGSDDNACICGTTAVSTPGCETRFNASPSSYRSTRPLGQVICCVGLSAAATPSITSLSPTSGAVGASVTITGTNFGSTPGTSTVKFNGTTATTIGSWSATSIVATVPTGATTGNVVVTVSGVASNGSSFTVVSDSKHHEFIANVRGGRYVGDDHGDELRIDAGHEHGSVQRDDGDDDYELECDVNKGLGADGSDHGQRSGPCQWGEQQRVFIRRAADAEHHELIADDGSSRRVGDDHRDKFRIDAGHEHGEVQRDDSVDDRELERNFDCGHSSDRRDHGERCGDGERSSEQRIVVHGGVGAEHYESIADVRSGRCVGDDHRNEFRINAGYKHSSVQRDDGNNDRELECDFDRGYGSDRRDHGERCGSCQRGEQQRIIIYGVAHAQHYELIAELGSRRRLGNDYRNELWIDARLEHGEV